MILATIYLRYNVPEGKEPSCVSARRAPSPRRSSRTTTATSRVITTQEVARGNRRQLAVCSPDKGVQVSEMSVSNREVAHASENA